MRKTLYLCDTNLVVSPMAEILHNQLKKEESTKAISAAFLSDHSNPWLTWGGMVNKNIFPFLKEKGISLNNSHKNISLFPDIIDDLENIETIVFLTELTSSSNRLCELTIGGKKSYEYIKENFSGESLIRPITGSYASELSTIYDQLIELM